MAKVDSSMFLEEDEIKFIEDTRRAINVSGVEIMLDKVEIEELIKEVEETDKKLRLFL